MADAAASYTPTRIDPGRSTLIPSRASVRGDADRRRGRPALEGNQPYQDLRGMTAGAKSRRRSSGKHAFIRAPGGGGRPR